METGEREEVEAATPGGILGIQEGSKMTDEPENLKGKKLEVEKSGKTGEEQGKERGGEGGG